MQTTNMSALKDLDHEVGVDDLSEAQNLKLLHLPVGAGRFLRQFTDRVDTNTRAYFAWVYTARWLGFRMDILVVIVITASCFFSVAVNEYSESVGECWGASGRMLRVIALLEPHSGFGDNLTLVPSNLSPKWECGSKKLKPRQGWQRLKCPEVMLRTRSGRGTLHITQSPPF